MAPCSCAPSHRPKRRSSSRRSQRIAQAAPFRRLVTPGGYTMSVAMTNCGRVGWVSDRTGYRYDPVDPDTGLPWPAMPAAFLDLAVRAAAEAGFAGYDPDACLINRYVAGAKLGLHQDKDEKDQWAPIVSVSLGLPAVFLWGGKRRGDSIRRFRLESGDIAVWGGPGALYLPRRRPAQGWRTSAHRRRPHQSHLPQGLLRVNSRHLLISK